MTLKYSTETNMVLRFIQKCWMPIAIIIIIIAIIISLFRALTPWASHYKNDVEAHLSVMLGQKVTISSMETSWYWLEPVIKLNEISISDAAGKTLKLNKLLVGFKILSSLEHWKFEPGILYIDDIHLSLRQSDSGWRIDGISNNQPQINVDKDVYTVILAWLSTQEKVVLRNVSTLIHLNDGSVIPFNKLSLTIDNNGDKYHLQGHATLSQTNPTEVSVLADINTQENDLNNAKGSIYIEAKGIMPAQWQGFIPKLPIHIEGGQGNVTVWFDFAKNKITSFQSELDFEHLAWQRLNNDKSQLIQSFKANLGWKQTNNGWIISGDKIQLRADGVTWPENAIKVSYNNDNQLYQVSINHIILESILATDISWPEKLKPIIATQPKGYLNNTDINIHNNELEYLLTKFDNISWQANDKTPAVNGLSGAVYWQPLEGRIELNSNDAEVKASTLPSIYFSQINTSIDWKQLSHGLRVSISNLLLESPDLTFTAVGVIDEPETPMASRINLVAKFAASNAEKWLEYIPSEYLKPKLNQWLKNDIKHIGKASGQLTINGVASDFPFDNGEGTFKILSHIGDVDLLINHDWPINQNIDGYIRVDKRNFNANIQHAKLKDVVIDNMNLRIDNIGLDNETLLIHTKIGASAEKIKDYIFDSPLKKGLSKLNQLEIYGLLGLDLQLEIPLYPENDKVLSQGVVTFNNNRAILRHDENHIELSNITGSLDFTETGIADSTIKSSLAGDPIAINIKSQREPTPQTVVDIKGSTTIELLRTKFKLPILDLMSGPLDLDGKLTITDDPNDLDHLTISSTMQGLAVNLPPPFDKSRQEKALFTMDLNFNPDKALRIRFNYDDRLSSDLWFRQRNESLNLEKGEIRLGSGKALWQKQPGVQIIGSLPSFDLKKWQQALSKMHNDESNNQLRDAIHFIDIKIKNTNLFHTSYSNIALKANLLSDKRWAIKIKQSSIDADLRYLPSTNTLTGNLTKLYLSKKMVDDAEDDAHETSLKPNEIPNLNLAIEQLKFDDVDVGSANIKSKSRDNIWLLEEGEITSPTYALNLTGQWVRNGLENHTTIQADLKTNNLEKSLHRWNLNPAVEAKQGEVQFSGSWPGSIADYSIGKIQGQMEITIKDGRITHLTPEAEQKIGIGKLLSILSLQTIPRRLKLDFSDLSKPGYSFDKFNGNFKVNKGTMTTNDSYIEGPIAYATMKGSLNLTQQLYDLNLHVSPHITASLPVVATIAGGPIAGIATWVASKIISKGMQKVTGYSYKISGPWMEPVVQQLQIYRNQQQSAKKGYIDAS